MIKISKATAQESLAQEWQSFTRQQYGEGTKWKELTFRFKATENDVIIGTIEGKYEPGVLYIAALMVSETARGKGIGKKLIEYAEKWGKNKGAHRIWLTTGKDWSNRAFYEKIGFVYLAELPDFYFHKDFVIYTRTIL